MMTLRWKCRRDEKCSLERWRRFHSPSWRSWRCSSGHWPPQCLPKDRDWNIDIWTSHPWTATVDDAAWRVAIPDHARTGYDNRITSDNTVTQYSVTICNYSFLPVWSCLKTRYERPTFPLCTEPGLCSEKCHRSWPSRPQRYQKCNCRVRSIANLSNVKSKAVEGKFCLLNRSLSTHRNIS